MPRHHYIHVCILIVGIYITYKRLITYSITERAFAILNVYDICLANKGARAIII